VQDALADEDVKGVVITSAKKDFAAGMDLNVIAAMRDGGPEAIFAGVMQMHHVLRRIERAGMDPKTLKGGKPIVAALPGTALLEFRMDDVEPALHESSGVREAELDFLTLVSSRPHLDDREVFDPLGVVVGQDALETV